ncbi:unnamed protein product [Spirodela intermedia]|uniref:CCHC-type domain-containing protein n=1 Tax=Spirodela intermedia TaxID=51605 RepID=A0A7I8I9M7_SPIIN|nr:unnamed protein product [Spirodela intermedia]CAA6653762.1 unnamed protein product [Spirodela intermedia]
MEGVRERSNGGTWEASLAATVVAEGSNKKKKKKKKQKKKRKGESMPIVRNEDESAVTHSAVSETNGDMSDNIVFRKLLRGPRYFEPGSTQLETCYNCGEEGHTAAYCTAEKRKKPCFVCGMFGHNANKCSQGQDCFICKRRGHLAKDCPDKQKRTYQDTRICIRCGGIGHDMSSCRNDSYHFLFAENQCYVCKGFGHFCCAEFAVNSPRKISCYNCGDSGHSGVGCAKPRGEPTIDVAPKLCYICGEEGHFARGCTRRSSSKFDRRQGEPAASTPKSTEYRRTTPTHAKKRKEFSGSRSLPRDLGNGSRSSSHSNGFKKNHPVEGGRSGGSAGKSRSRGGWIVDDPGDYNWRSRSSPRSKPWNSPYSPRTPVRKSFKHYDNAGSLRQYHEY